MLCVTKEIALHMAYYLRWVEIAIEQIIWLSFYSIRVEFLQNYVMINGTKGVH